MSTRFMEKDVGHCMDGPIFDRNLTLKMQRTFLNLRQNWPHIPAENIRFHSRRSVHAQHSSTDFYNAVRIRFSTIQSVKTDRRLVYVHYSDRVTTLTELTSLLHAKE
jgi:hypothetical protein